MWPRTKTATAMAFRDQRRRPLVLILLVLLPAYVITKSIAQTEATPRRIELPGDVWITTTMKNLHGPEMGKLSVAFAAALVGVFVMQSALQGDRRLVAVALLVMAVFIGPASWPALVVALVLIGLIYAALGALAGALLGRLAATYVMLFLVMTDLGVVQSAMFHAAPVRFAWLLPGYAPTRVMLDGTFANSFHAGFDLLLACGWLTTLAAAVYLVFRRAVGAGT